MCISKRVCTVCHVLWSFIYIGVGAVQFVIGLFFLISLSMLKVGSNIWTGAWNIFIGILSSMLACSGEFTAVKQEGLLFLTISILVVNTVNIVVLEIGEWYLFMTDDMKAFINQKSLKNIVFYARMTTSISTGVAILASFLDSQFTFCSIQKAREPKNARETISDIEYIMPRKQGTPLSNQAQVVHGNYAQSWVFDMDTSGPHTNAYLKTNQVPSDESNKTKDEEEEEDEEDETSDSGEEAEPAQSTFVKPTVHVEPATDESCAVVRHLNYMKSFSRTPSPVGVSESSSQESEMNHPAIYECLEKICEPEIYAAHLSAAKAVSKDRHIPSSKSAIKGMERTMGDGRTDDVADVESSSGAKQAGGNYGDRLITTHSEGAEKVQYASLMLELQQKIRSKKKDTVQTVLVKGPTNPVHSVTTSVKSRETSRGSSQQDSPQDNSQKTDTKDSDTEFSRELEAALQFLQDLESPNTIDTPSETCRSIDGAEVPTLTNSRRGSNCPIAMTVKWRDSLSDHSLEETARRATNRLSMSPPKESLGNGSAGAHAHDAGRGEVGEGAVHANGKEAQTSFTSSSSTRVERSGEKVPSDSSSGYSSPSATTSKLPTPYCSKPSSAHGSTNNLVTSDDHLSYVISEKGSTAVISLFSASKGDRASPSQDISKKPNGILQLNVVSDDMARGGSHSHSSTGLYKNVIRITGDGNTSNAHRRSHRQYLPHTETISEVVSREDASLAISRHEENNVSLYGEAISSGHNNVVPKSDQNVSSSHDSSRWNVRSLLGKKTVTMAPELKNAIVQSESLAYLSELELLARHSRIKSEQRQIEQRVHQKLFGKPPEESDC
ncbi:serine-rich adhesin for platelets-like isoform X2 [Ischnura elegans]|nr:serine-rich adhesin for platelets-like isoform X2 [Ischnura elegans]XP_046395824.1 serine-rich adhesin for platelets-like isoform X2 [Ischnura elegans]XP_046395831.1 serine-rich adhesin for platelets-like isoform X2 [Ischnura elegans]